MSALSKRLVEANVDNLSARRIAERSGAGVHHGTISKYLKGDHPRRPDEITLRVFSDVLRIPMPELRELAGAPRGERTRYEPPPEADRLDERQRKALNELILSIVAAPADEGRDGDGDAAPNKMPPGDGSPGGVVNLRPDVDPGYPADAAALEEGDDEDHGHRPV